MKKIFICLLFFICLISCKSTDSAVTGSSSAEPYEYSDSNGLVIDNTKYSYVDEASFGKKIIPDGNVILHRENFHIANMYPTYMAIYKRLMMKDIILTDIIQPARSTVSFPPTLSSGTTLSRESIA